jgi:hypothetical protein
MPKIVRLRAIFVHYIEVYGSVGHVSVISFKLKKAVVGLGFQKHSCAGRLRTVVLAFIWRWIRHLFNFFLDSPFI